MISAGRSAWYGAYEPLRLGIERGRPWPYIHIKDARKASVLNPLVSVLIPTYNRADLLCTRALPSVLAQTYTNLEIIVADHSSTDDTEKRVAALGDTRLRALTVPRRRRYPPSAENHWLAGPVDPLNAALSAARGAWLARIDDDDEWTSDHVETLLRFAQAGNYEFVSSAYARHFAGKFDGKDGDYVETIGAEDGIGGTQTWLWRSYLRFARWNPDCWRKRWHRVNDMDLADRFRRMGTRIGYLDEVTATIRPRPGEKHVGSKAYKENAEKTEAFYSFD